jgi:DNA mismatch repair protein MutS
MPPLRQQYLRIKRRYPEAIVFFRLGDFYETFDQDAKTASRELEIVLTSRGMGNGQRVPMAGIPHHALDNYLARLIAKGYKVAICEQLSEPKSKGLVERDVIRVVTPGTVVEPELLEGKANNYLAALVSEREQVGIAYVDITTSEFQTTQLSLERASSELERLRPSEILAPHGSDLANISSPVTHLDEQWFELETARQLLLEHFSASSVEGYGCAHLPLAIRAAGAILHYLGETQRGALVQLTRLSTYSTESFMILDPQTRRNLELFHTFRQGIAGSLLAVIDLTKTAMGGRLLRRWLGQPLLDITLLSHRLDVVAWFQGNAVRRTKTITLLSQIADLERLINRVRGDIATPRELISLRRSLEAASQIRETMGKEEASPIRWLLESLKPCQDVVALISQAIVDEPPQSLGDGVIKQGFSAELDEIKSASRDAKRYLSNLERQERERTEIKSLKVGYNKVFGYYIEVSKPNLSQVPADYIRKQTLVGAERFFTPELKEYESQILNAQERIAELEASIFRQVCNQVGAAAERILEVASALAQMDVFSALGEAAARYGYVRPKLTEEDAIIIHGGRHPVVEQTIIDEPFVPNDTYLCSKDAQMVILTGPNMSGKSTYLRQVALIVLLAQIGSFVPADSATIGIVDRIFTRVGAQDELAMGRSTFMVEMEETANILNHATQRSLVILDEIGRGTSTYDGISIAQAVAEYIHNYPKLGAKTLFATHYHELVELANILPRVKNFNVAVAEEGGKVVFLRKIIPGGADKSYGIHVAQLAGLPRSVIHRAQEVLVELESDRGRKGVPEKMHKPQPQQLPLFSPPSPILDELSKLDIDSMTPLEALTKLYELKQKAKEG